MLRHLTDQPGLADPGLTVDQDGGRHPLGRGGQSLVEESLLDDPSGERAARDARGVAHHQSVPPAAAHVTRNKGSTVHG